MKLFAPLAFATAAVITLTACSNPSTPTEATAESNPASSDVASRQALMKDWRAANDIIKGMTENPASFDAAVLKEQTSFLADSSSKMWSHFADASAKGNSTDAVWNDPTAFKAATDKFDATVTALNTAAQTASSAADIEAALGQVGESCGSCHKVFKQ